MALCLCAVNAMDEYEREADEELRGTAEKINGGKLTDPEFQLWKEKIKTPTEERLFKKYEWTPRLNRKVAREIEKFHNANWESIKKECPTLRIENARFHLDNAQRLQMEKAAKWGCGEGISPMDSEDW